MNELNYLLQWVIFCGKYRHDCFVTWNSSEQRLKQIHQFLNSFDKGLQCKMEVSEEHLCFLDLKISILDNTFVTTLFSKPTDSNLYFQTTSYQRPKSVLTFR